MAKANTVLTSGEVAEICNVSIGTVYKWVDKGFLNGYRISGSRGRRIPIDSLTRFMAAHKMPMPEHWPTLKKAARSARDPAAGRRKEAKPQYLLDPAQVIDLLQTPHGWQCQMLELLRKALPPKPQKPPDEPDPDGI